MSTTTTTPAVTAVRDEARQGFGDVVRAEWIKLSSVRSTWWTMIALVVLGAGLTIALCAANAEWLASPDADESPGSFITWGMMIAQVTALVLGVLAVTSEYGTGMVRSTFAAVPRRGRVLAAKALLVATLLFVVVVVLAFGQPITSAIALGGFMMLIYIPLGYFTDLFFYNRRQQQLARKRGGR
jgi:ABC-2 type transport system permease protein